MKDILLWVVSLPNLKFDDFMLLFGRLHKKNRTN